ncbi:MAG: PilZ domain-containing protein [Proteobacteria bacterium]|nr:PilZ domain-containing protein [Pseudomonadota bacterium]
MPASRTPQKAQSDRKIPTMFEETVLVTPATAWLQVLRNDSWDPASVTVLAVHTDGQGVRLDSPIPLPRGTKVMVNVNLRPSEAVHLQGVVHVTRKSGSGSMATLRFEHQTEADRKTLAAFAAAAPPTEQPTEPTTEKRRYKRFVKSVPVQYQLLRADGEIIPGEGQMMTLDIGGGGMKIRVDQKLEMGDLAYLHLPLDSVPFFSLGRVIWIEDSRVPDRWVAGLQFVDLSESEQSRLNSLLATAR